MVVDIELRGSFAKPVDMRFANLKRAARFGHLLVRSPYWRAGCISPLIRSVKILGVLPNSSPDLS
jgi:hypothetical protein